MPNSPIPNSAMDAPTDGEGACSDGVGAATETAADGTAICTAPGGGLSPSASSAIALWEIISVYQA